MKTVFILILLGIIIAFVPRYAGVRLLEEDLSRKSIAPLAKDALEHLEKLDSIMHEVSEEMSLNPDDKRFYAIIEHSSKARYKMSVVYGYYLAEKHEKPYENDVIAFAILSTALLRLGYLILKGKSLGRPNRESE